MVDRETAAMTASNPRNKSFRLSSEEIKPLAPGLGSCIATDLITVDWERVGFMYREAPSNAVDSGWRFMSGGETPEYIDNPANLEIYDVNTIANYDPEIVPFLSAPIGSVFERENLTGPFSEVFDFNRPDD